MLTLQEQITKFCDIDFQHFGLFTYVTVSSKYKIVKLREDDSTLKRLSTRKKEPKGTSFCITRKLYEANKDKSFFFVDKVSREDQFEAITSKFFKAYQAGIGWKIEFADWHIDLLQALKDGKFERVVKNRYMNDHTLLDSKDRVIYHRVRFDYVHGQVHESNYRIDDLVKHFKKRKDITNIDVISIPYYNADFSGERAVEFTYIPPMSRWNQFVGWYYPDTVGSKYTLFEKLGVDKFRKKD
jgi:hypothetical protein